MARTPTEFDWDACPEPDRLLTLVWPSALESRPYTGGDLPRPLARRFRLFGVACARQVWEFLPTDARSAVLIAERLAERRAAEADLMAAALQIDHGAFTFQRHAWNAAGWASAAVEGRGFLATGRDIPHWNPAQVGRDAGKAIATRSVGPAPPGRTMDPAWHAAWVRAFAAARAAQADFARDIFPPPLYAPAIEPRWLTSTVLVLAGQMDRTGDFSLTPILADALQDAGCEDAVVLGRCRHPGGHVRGNWVVDAILGRL